MKALERMEPEDLMNDALDVCEALLQWDEDIMYGCCSDKKIALQISKMVKQAKRIVRIARGKSAAKKVHNCIYKDEV
jgi:hypothetical protein